MKKIVLITASVLALGAASIAADADGVSMLNGGTQPTLMSFAAPVSKASDDDNTRGDRVSQHRTDRSVRLVKSGNASADSCAAAHWPYYPSECLKRVETTDL
jgi:hypothetical protein